MAKQNGDKKWQDPPAEMICASLNGNNLAVEQLLDFYDAYINCLNMLEIRDCNDFLIKKYVDEDRKQIISIAFIKSIRNFAKILLKEKNKRILR